MDSRKNMIILLTLPVCSPTYHKMGKLKFIDQNCFLCYCHFLSSKGQDQKLKQDTWFFPDLWLWPRFRKCWKLPLNVTVSNWMLIYNSVFPMLYYLSQALLKVFMIVLKYNSILKLSQSSMISEHLLCDENFTTCFIYKIYFSFIINQDND